MAGSILRDETCRVPHQRTHPYRPVPRHGRHPFAAAPSSGGSSLGYNAACCPLSMMFARPHATDQIIMESCWTRENHSERAQSSSSTSMTATSSDWAFPLVTSTDLASPTPGTRYLCSTAPQSRGDVSSVSRTLPVEQPYGTQTDLVRLCTLPCSWATPGEFSRQ